MHPRASLSAISTFSWELDADLAFYAEAGITNVGISVAKLERFGWEDGTRRVVDAGLRVTNLIGLGPFHLAERFRIVPKLEMFNTFNNKNNINPLSSPQLFDFNGFLRVGVGDPRQAQLSVRLEF